MAETTADVRRDIELTRERMSTTLAQLEQKLNLMQIVRENPWPALAVAVGAGVLLSGSRSDVKAAAATVAATRGASSRVGTVLDDVMARLVEGVQEAFEARITTLVDDLKGAIGAPSSRGGAMTERALASTGGADASGTDGTRPDARTSRAAPAGMRDMGGSTAPPIDAPREIQPTRAD